MNRLTKRNEDGHAYYPNCYDWPCLRCTPISCTFYDKVCERLAAYEDTGMEPEEIAALKRERDAAVSDLIMLGDCESCAKDCGITGCQIIGCGCKGYIWRGDEDAARKARACGNWDCPHQTGAPCPASDGCGGYEEVCHENEFEAERAKNE